MPALRGGQSGLHSVVAEVAKLKGENAWVGLNLIAHHAHGVQAARGLLNIEGDAIAAFQDTHALTHNGRVAHEKLFARVFLDGAKPTYSVKLAYYATTAAD